MTANFNGFVYGEYLTDIPVQSRSACENEFRTGNLLLLEQLQRCSNA
jgi:hypothetical protein